LVERFDLPVVLELAAAVGRLPLNATNFDDDFPIRQGVAMPVETLRIPENDHDVRVRIYAVPGPL